jgi:hypothetical protein
MIDIKVDFKIEACVETTRNFAKCKKYWQARGMEYWKTGIMEDWSTGVKVGADPRPRNMRLRHKMEGVSH